MKLIFAVVLYITVQTTAQTIESCDSKIYCQGRLLDTVQKARIFPDSKSFVDLSLKSTVDKTLSNFDDMMASTDNNPSKQDLLEFVNSNFQSGNELFKWVPKDFNPDPEFLSNITDPSIEYFARILVHRWPSLGRRVKMVVKKNPDQYSIIFVPNGFIIPGGRFKESYYWDSYWIIKGLLVSDMEDTARLMIENFFHLVETYGFIPNGARVYFLNRSQLPLLTAMTYNYIQKTNNLDWLAQHIDTLEKELQFWFLNRNITVNGKDFVRYAPESNTPRPESYGEDIVTCSVHQDEKERANCYSNLKAGAESGWDYSSRWFHDNSGSVNLSYIDVKGIVPVDLNAVIANACRDMANFYDLLANDKKSQEWAQKYEQKKEDLSLFYDNEDGIWYDYDLQKGDLNKEFYPSNFAPLWMEVYDKDKSEELGKRAADYFKAQGLTNYKGGIPTSLHHTGEQWDFPNAWPPLQELVIMGLERTGEESARELASTLAGLWINANMLGYAQSEELYEKYDSEHPGKYGGGGEYVVQTGFGWTNGAALALIEHFNSRLAPTEK